MLTHDALFKTGSLLGAAASLESSASPSRLESGVTRPNLARTDCSGVDGSTGSRWSLSARLSKCLVAMTPVTVYVEMLQYVIECELNLGLH